MDYDNMTLEEKRHALFSQQEYVKPEESKFKINAVFLKRNVFQECYRELMVSYFPMLPLLEDTVALKDADYILYMHPYVRLDDMSAFAVKQLHFLDQNRKEGAEIIVVGKAANVEKLLNGSIKNITFWYDHFTEKLGKKFGLDIKEQYFVYDEEYQHLAIWPVDGCLRKCAFCRTTFANIRFESLSLETIKKHLDYYKENFPEKMKKISLRAENLTEYGIDIYGCSKIVELIELIESYEEIESIEFPIGLAICEITDELLDLICKSKKIKYIAMNLEVGSNRLLKFVGKGHTRERAIYIFDKIRKAHPEDVIIETNIIIGLPTEQLSDIYELADLIVQTRPDYVTQNYYSMSPYHPIAKFPQLSESLREYHLKLLIKLLKENVKRDFVMYHHILFKKKDSRTAIRNTEYVKRIQQKFDIGVHMEVETHFKAKK